MSMKQDGDDHTTKVTLEGGLAALALAMTLLIVLLEISARYVFNVSYLWADEVSRFLMIWSVYLGSVAAIRAGTHLRVDLITRLVSGISRRWLRLLSDVWVCSYSIAIAIAGYAYVRSTYSFGFMSADSHLPIPMWVIQLIIPLGYSLMAIYALYHVIRSARETNK